MHGLITCIIFPLIYRFWHGGKEDTAIAIMQSLSYMTAFTCFFTNNMYYFPTSVGSGGKEDTTADGHSYHVYTLSYMLAFSMCTQKSNPN